MNDEQLPPENMKGDPKPWVFKKQENGQFKVYERGTDNLLPGFEAEEFNSPLVGGRYISALLKAAEDSAVEKAKTVTLPAPTTSTKVEPQATETGMPNKPFEIPIIGEEPVIHVLGTKYFELVIHEQDGDAKRKDIFVTDGVSRDFLIQFDVPVILPEGCLRVFRESVYTEMESVDNIAQGSVLLIEKQVPRFSIQVNKEIPQLEAEAWLREKKKVYLKRA